MLGVVKSKKGVSDLQDEEAGDHDDSDQEADEDEDADDESNDEEDSDDEDDGVNSDAGEDGDEETGDDDDEDDDFNVFEFLTANKIRQENTPRFLAERKEYSQTIVKVPPSF